MPNTWTRWPEFLILSLTRVTRFRKVNNSITGRAWQTSSGSKCLSVIHVIDDDQRGTMETPNLVGRTWQTDKFWPLANSTFSRRSHRSKLANFWRVDRPQTRSHDSLTLWWKITSVPALVRFFFSHLNGGKQKRLMSLRGSRFVALSFSRFFPMKEYQTIHKQEEKWYSRQVIRVPSERGRIFTKYSFCKARREGHGLNNSISRSPIWIKLCFE